MAKQSEVCVDEGVLAADIVCLREAPSTNIQYIYKTNKRCHPCSSCWFFLSCTYGSFVCVGVFV